MSTEEDDAWAKMSISEKLSDLGYDLDTPIDEAKLTEDQRETLHGVCDMLAGAISVGHSTLEKTAASDCDVCKVVTEEWNEVLKVDE